jgi:hypothetical protein
MMMITTAIAKAREKVREEATQITMAERGREKEGITRCTTTEAKERVKEAVTLDTTTEERERERGKGKGADMTITTMDPKEEKVKT